MKKIALSGIKPTGTLHIGNYLGMIKPAFALIENYQTLAGRLKSFGPYFEPGF